MKSLDQTAQQSAARRAPGSRHLARLRALVPLLALLTGACAADLAVPAGPISQAPSLPPPPPPTPPPPPPATVPATSPGVVAAARADINRVIVLSCQTASDCATLPIGARACGGPEAYLAYAPSGTDLQRLKQAAARYEQLRRQQIDARAEMSTCEVLADPGAQCLPPGQCQVLPSRRGLPGAVTR
jgi:hypothetical protein